MSDLDKIIALMESVEDRKIVVRKLYKAEKKGLRKGYRELKGKTLEKPNKKRKA